jgi:hypothetical protein
MRRNFTTKLENEIYKKIIKKLLSEDKILKLNLHSGFKACGNPSRPAKVTFHGTQQQKYHINIYDEH